MTPPVATQRNDPCRLQPEPFLRCKAPLKVNRATLSSQSHLLVVKWKPHSGALGAILQAGPVLLPLRMTCLNSTFKDPSS